MVFGIPARALRVYASEPALIPLVATVVAGIGIVVFQFDRILTNHPDVDSYGLLAPGTAETRTINPLEKDFVHHRPFHYDHEDPPPGKDPNEAAKAFLENNPLRKPRFDWMPVGMRVTPGRFRPKEQQDGDPSIEGAFW